MNENDKIVYAIYVRVSTADQNIENQLNALRELAQLRFWQPYAEYIDKAISGSKRHRPLFDQMIKDAKANRFKVILTVKLDRLGRSFFHLFQVVEELQQIGVDIITLDGKVDTTTIQGKVFFTISAIFAEIERDMISERTKAGLQRAKAGGKRLGRPSKDIDMKRVAQLRSQGYGWRRMEKELGVSYQTIRSHVLRKSSLKAPTEKIPETGG
jgi:DNA invertase Pin-like site-specific DNA recombinase